MAQARILLGDVGGTHIRFAWAADNGAARDASIFFTSAFASFEDALTRFLENEGRPVVHAAAFCAAGPAIGGRIAMTNIGWSVSEETLARVLGTPRVRVTNDFTAAALGLPHLRRGDLVPLGGGEGDPDAPIALLGPGTGLGISGLVPDGHGGFVPIAGEGGHADLAPASDREIAVVFHLLREHGHVSAERVLSGGGLETLYLALAALDGAAHTRRLTAPDIAKAAREGRDRLAVETLALFTGWLGAVAGDVALTLGARGGVYVAGGIVPKWGALFDAGLFRRRFEAKGRLRGFLAPIPAYLVTAEDLAFRGLAALARAL